MPLYEYRCTACGYSFEKIQSFSATPESVCPKCAGVLIRPVTAPALRFEGAGWYVNDYAGKGGSKKGDSSPTADAASGKDAGGDGKSGESKAAETTSDSSGEGKKGGGDGGTAAPATSSTPASSTSPAAS